ncbi:single-stranded DNA-binding protein [Streptosporangium carneum]|uniref:Single-stranded DNA-binding protein n=1 Tax=Streptosporangium carneum TaxID=47481 RepID=A0A9W6I5J6_9ACTN|nr:single-stranded DNA-binding protein [Streptosporangium carneum]GLK12421.1 hypothetical protein GCM10017600_58310 [Streptosporangium carneum]
MNDIHVTLTGNVAAPPRQHTFPDGSRVTSLKVASTSRYFDRENQQWCNGETTYFGVRCFRGLADNVAQSVRVGQPIVVQGRLRIREFTHDGERRFMPEVEANSLGHDLRWGLGSFSKPQRGGAAPVLGRDQRTELDRETHDWAMGGAAPAADFATVPVSVTDSTVPDASGALAPVRDEVDGETAETTGGESGAVRRASGGGRGARRGTRGEHGVADRDTVRETGHSASHDADHGPGHDAKESPKAGRGLKPGDDETPWPVEVRMAA